jgi:CMP-N-acetylneuraminic acid synthetase
MSVVRYVADALGVDAVCLLQPTSPLRTSADVNRVVAAARPFPGSTFTVRSDGYPSGSIYVFKRPFSENWLELTRLEIRLGHAEVDIDTAADLAWAEGIWRNNESRDLHQLEG